MSGKRAPESLWLKNFTKCAEQLINEQRDEGYLVNGLIMTIGLYNKLAEAYGYDPDNLLGYKIKILEQSQEELEEEGDLILVSGKPLN